MARIEIVGLGTRGELFDSLAAGVPVIQNSQGWLKKIFDREQCGTVPPDDPETLARAVLTLVRQPELRERMSMNAKRIAMEQFDRDLLAVRMRQALLTAATGAK